MCGLQSPAMAQAKDKQAVPGKISTAQAKALEEDSYALAINAATWASPVVIMYLLRYNDAVGPNPKAAPNDI
jgi:hypothetical protein